MIPRYIKNIRVKKKALYIIMALTACLLVAFIYYYHNEKKQEKLNSAKVESLFTSNNCSKKALDSVIKEKPDLKQIKASIALLTYQSDCLYSLGQLKQAIPKYEQLQQMYLKNGNQTMVNVVNQEIFNAEDQISHPFTNYTSSLGKPEAELTKPTLVK